MRHLIHLIVFLTCLLTTQLTLGKTLSIPIQRTIATQPITTLEIVAIVKSLLNGRVLSVRKQSSYTNPDCHHVKLLEDKGEFQIIELGCLTSKELVRENTYIFSH